VASHVIILIEKKEIIEIPYGTVPNPMQVLELILISLMNFGLEQDIKLMQSDTDQQKQFRTRNTALTCPCSTELPSQTGKYRYLAPSGEQTRNSAMPFRLVIKAGLPFTRFHVINFRSLAAVNANFPAHQLVFSGRDLA
jgi:hypothetical protein